MLPPARHIPKGAEGGGLSPRATHSIIDQGSGLGGDVRPDDLSEVVVASAFVPPHDSRPLRTDGICRLLLADARDTVPVLWTEYQRPQGQQVQLLVDQSVDEFEPESDRP